MSPEPAVSREPIRYLVGEFVVSRSDMEFVNGLVGVSVGGWLLLPTPSLIGTPSFAILEPLMPEIGWAVVLMAWGALTFLAWLCPRLQWGCRFWMMFANSCFWSALGAVAFLSSHGVSPFVPLFFSVAFGCVVSCRRMLESNAHVRAL